MTTKECSKCGDAKLHSEFYNQLDARDGKTSQCKTCMTAYRRSVVARTTVWHRENYLRNKARFNELHKQYRNTHAAQIKAHQSSAAYKSKKMRWDRGYYERNTERLRRKSRAIALAKPALHRAYKNSYMYERDMGLCQICGLVVEEGDFSLDHRIPISGGGQHSMENCRTAHLICNIRKSDKLPEHCGHLWMRS